MELDRAKLAGLLGKRVRVVLTEADPQVVTTGILLGYNQDGEVEVLEADGCIHHCWPMLHVEEL